MAEIDSAEDLELLSKQFGPSKSDEVPTREITDPDVIKTINREVNRRLPVDRTAVTEDEAEGIKQDVAGQWSAGPLDAKQFVHHASWGLDEPVMAAASTPFELPREWYRAATGAESRSIYETYKHRLNLLRKRRELEAEAAPISSGVSGFIGAVAAPGTKGVASFMRDVAASQFKSKTGQFVGTAGLTGVPIGAAQELAFKDDVPVENYLSTLAYGGLKGGVIGAAAAPFVAGGMKGIGWAAEKAAPVMQTVSSALGQYLPGMAGRALRGESHIVDPTYAPGVVQTAKDLVRGQPGVIGQETAYADRGAPERVTQAIDEVAGVIRDRAAKAGRPEPEHIDEALRKEILPEPSNNIVRRGATMQSMEDMITRRYDLDNPGINPNPVANDTKARIARDYGITPRTLDNYYNKFLDKNRTQSNIAEHVFNVAREQESVGAHQPMRELLRVAAGSRGEGTASAQLLANLEQRQSEQAGRMVEHIEQSVGILPRNARNTTMGAPKSFDEAKNKAEEILTSVADRDYDVARLAVSPVTRRPYKLHIEGPLSEARRQVNWGVPGSKETDKLNWALGIYKSVNHRGPTTGPKTDTARYLNARWTIDQEIKRLKAADDKPTAAVLAKFRRHVNDRVQAINPELKAADAVHGEGRTADNILDKAYELSQKLTAGSRADMKFFDSLNQQQQHLFRVAFARNLTDTINSTRDGSATVATRFMNPATRDMIQKIFGKDAGSALNRNIMKEAATTGTLASAAGGSQTTPWRDALDQWRLAVGIPLETARAAATGNPQRLLNAVTDKLTYKMSNKKIGEIGELLTDTNPVRNLQTLKRIRDTRIAERVRAERRAEAIRRMAEEKTVPLVNSTEENTRGF